ncbi:MAG: YeeE/YedE thiosulfate transporter family protein [Bacteroidota bacterium]|nr:YeeE/YedE thiosulfate transporter family protein [Bacteroidota bacterium]
MSDQPISNEEETIEYETRHLDSACLNESHLKHPWWYNLKYLLVGLLFGVIFVKAEIISWFRIQEMFRMESFHMYGVIGSAVAVGILSVFLIKKFNIKTIYGEEVEFKAKTFNKGHIIGGFMFGLGWAMTGACPGPLFAQIGTGATVIAVTLFSAIAGTWIYGYFREKLPH